MNAAADNEQVSGKKSRQDVGAAGGTREGIVAIQLAFCYMFDIICFLLYSYEEELNCIDAIEGTVKEIITRIYNQYVTFGQDDTEYIMNIKAVVEGSEEFALKNTDIISTPQILKTVLYDFAKDLWLQNLQKRLPLAADEAPAEREGTSEQDGYYEYYYDHIYHHGGYPR